MSVRVSGFHAAVFQLALSRRHKKEPHYQYQVPYTRKVTHSLRGTIFGPVFWDARTRRSSF